MHQLIEQAVYRYPDKRMEGMRLYRIEYGGHANDCWCEGTIWLPAHIDPERIEEVLNDEDRNYDYDYDDSPRIV